jgi:hypothetical protein
MSAKLSLTDNDGNRLDFFDYPQYQPKAVHALIIQYGRTGLDYKEAGKMLKKMNELGFTFGWDQNGTLSDLHPMVPMGYRKRMVCGSCGWAEIYNPAENFKGSGMCACGEDNWIEKADLYDKNLSNYLAKCPIIKNRIFSIARLYEFLHG